MVAIQTDEARFRAFAFDLYEGERIRSILLRLQDEKGLDVPQTLFCIWRGVEGRAVAEETMRAAVAFSGRWRESMTQPVRDLRRSRKGGVAGLPDDLSERARQQIAKAEIAIEEIQMGHLATMLSGERPVNGAIAANLGLYVAVAGISITLDDIEVLSGSVRA